MLTFGIKLLNIDLGLKGNWEYLFRISKTTKRNLEADFLHQFNLIIDLKNKRPRLIHGITKMSISVDITTKTEADSVSTMQPTWNFINC